MRPIPLLTTLVLALCGLAAHSPGQETLLDEGSLIISRNGAPIGREAYRIVRAAGGGGQAYRATATVSFDSLRVALRLTTDSTGGPLTYEAKVSVHNALTAHVAGSGRPGRFSTLSTTPHGESARDYVMGADPLLLDPQAFDPYFFATLPPHRTAFSVVDPRSGTQATFRFEERGEESIRVGRSTMNARHYALIGADGSSRDIWVDGNGHLLRVAIPTRSLVAQRDEPPR